MYSSGNTINLCKFIPNNVNRLRSSEDKINNFDERDEIISSLKGNIKSIASNGNNSKNSKNILNLA